MADRTDPRQDLLERIATRRAGVDAYLRERRPRVRRWATVTLVLTSLSAVFTAGPALGGVPFAEAVQRALGLEGLATLLEFGTLSVEDGVKLYQQYVTKIPFVDDTRAAARPA